MLDTLLKFRRQGISQHTLLFYQRCLSKTIGIKLTAQGINSFLGLLDCGKAKHAYCRTRGKAIMSILADSRSSIAEICSIFAILME